MELGLALVFRHLSRKTGYTMAMPNPDVEGSCHCCAGLASLARVPNPDRREESHVGARICLGYGPYICGGGGGGGSPDKKV